ncbi:Gfo/Idh/MocA family protein [Virgibacillus flavescens]|uniref:Gfo/Idh/MocA family protein n=1 Tax=Virgibacillus flavescens TaxID=1611422 RepID=UPI003D3517D8
MLKAGMIGCGYISKKHVETIIRLENMELHAVSDVQKGRMEETASFYQKNISGGASVKQYGDYQYLLHDPDIDVIIITVISSLHAKIAKQALLERKHVIVEKPLALSIKDADEIIKLARLKQRKVLVCHQLRYRPIFLKLKSLVENGMLGEPYLGTVTARINRSQDYYKSAAWRGSWEQDGGMLVNQGIHLVDLLVWLLGEVDTVYGEIARNNDLKEIEDVAAGIIHFSNKAKGTIEVNTITKPANQGYYLSLYFEKGTIILCGTGFDKLEHCYIEGEEQLVHELKEACNKKDEQFLMYQNFIDSILTNTVLVMDASEGKRALEVIFALYRSHNNKLPVKLPLLSFSTKEMKYISGRKE